MTYVTTEEVKYPALGRTWSRSLCEATCMMASFTDPRWRQDSCQWLQSSVSGSSLVGKKSFSLPTVESLLTRFLWAELGHVQVSEPVNSQGKECADWPGRAHAQTLEPALLHSRGIGALGRGFSKEICGLIPNRQGAVNLEQQQPRQTSEAEPLVPCVSSCQV